jgi:hypothetical protein
MKIQQTYAELGKSLMLVCVGLYELLDAFSLFNSAIHMVAVEDILNDAATSTPRNPSTWRLIGSQSAEEMKQCCRRCSPRI